MQTVGLTGILTGGTFTLSTPAPPLPQESQGRTTGPIAYNATPAQVQAALYTIQGMAGNVVVSGSPGFYSVTFQGLLAGQLAPQPDWQLQRPGRHVSGGPGRDASSGGQCPQRPDHHHVGSQLGGGERWQQRTRPGDHQWKPDWRRDRLRVRRLNIAGLDGLIDSDGFGIGVSVPNPGNVANLIQGNFIGNYLLYPVDP